MREVVWSTQRCPRCNEYLRIGTRKWPWLFWLVNVFTLGCVWSIDMVFRALLHRPIWSMRYVCKGCGLSLTGEKVRREL